MCTNFETSVIINETTTIKLIELNKKNNDNVFATAIYRHSRILLRTRWSFPSQMPVKSILVYSVVNIYSHYMPNRQFRVQSFLKHEFILVLKASLKITLIEKKPTSRDTSSSKWVVVDGKIKIYPFSNFWYLLCL